MFKHMPTHLPIHVCTSRSVCCSTHRCIKRSIHRAKNGLSVSKQVQDVDSLLDGLDNASTTALPSVLVPLSEDEYRATVKAK